MSELVQMIPNFSFWQIIVLIVLVIFGVIAIRISLNFDVNRYLEKRHEKIIQRIKNACPHMEIIVLEDKTVGFQCLFVSPSGTLQWQCTQCGLVVHQGPTEAEIERDAKYFIQNPKAYSRRQKKFRRLMKKAGIL